MSNDDQIADLARHIASKAEAIADGTLQGPRYAAVQNLRDSVDTLAAWIGDDR